MSSPPPRAIRRRRFPPNSGTCAARSSAAIWSRNDPVVIASAGYGTTGSQRPQPPLRISNQPRRCSEPDLAVPVQDRQLLHRLVAPLGEQVTHAQAGPAGERDTELHGAHAGTLQPSIP